MRQTVLVLSLVAITAGVAPVAHGQMKKDQPQQLQRPADPTRGVPMPVQKAHPDAAKRISIDEAFKLYKEDKAVFVDVRSKEQYDLGHIRGALSIPGSQLIRRFREVPPGKLVITYCACSAEQSSGRAVVDLNAHGVKNTAALVGGWASWKDSGKPTEKTR